MNSPYHSTIAVTKIVIWEIKCFQMFPDQPMEEIVHANVLFFCCHNITHILYIERGHVKKQSVKLLHHPTDVRLPLSTT